MGGGLRRSAQNNGRRSQRETESLPGRAGQEAASLSLDREDRRQDGEKTMAGGREKREERLPGCSTGSWVSKEQAVPSPTHTCGLQGATVSHEANSEEGLH